MRSRLREATNASVRNYRGDERDAALETRDDRYAFTEDADSCEIEVVERGE